ncbi:MAG: alpha-2-macroglobulin [Dysgonamonadaceae bacterium]|jgi:hypothetical protein|nr:alpha-2-macroglobulin [Dysgonamonadaceae bacterium]
MKSILICVLSVLISVSTNAQTKTNIMKSANNQAVSTWNEVQKFEEQSLPKSALDAVNLIYQDALRRGDSPQLIKALIHKLKYKTAIDAAEFPALIAETENFAANDANRVEQAVIYSLLAELYHQYYDSESWSINQRTAVQTPPEDMTTWPANLFIARITGLALLSLAPEADLQQTDALKYKDILETGEDSRTQRPTLYDFLIFRAIEMLGKLDNISAIRNYFPQTQPVSAENFAPAAEWVKREIAAGDCDMPLQILKLYQKLLAFRISQNNEFALLMADLERINFVNTHTFDADDAYLNALDNLEKQYENQDFCAEILVEKAEYWEIKSVYDADEESDNPKYKNEKNIFEICKYGITKYHNYKRIGKLEDILKILTRGQISVNTPNTVYPGNELELKFNYRNINNITVKIYRIDAPITAYTNRWQRGGLYKEYGKLVDTKRFTLINVEPYVFSDTTLKIPMKELGIYEYVVNTEPAQNETANGQFSVSRLATISREVDGKREYFVADRISGKPALWAKVNTYKLSNNKLVKINTLTTDANGLATGGDSRDEQFYNAELGADKGLITSPTPWISSYGSSQENAPRLNIFTDRAIYRPGQTVYFKGISFDANKESVLPDRAYKIVFRDANSKEISDFQAKTNEWGSFSGEFVIPQGLLNGAFSIQADRDGGYVSIRVEEYKRPTFEIEFDKNDKTPRLGAEAAVSGTVKTFSGVPVQETTLKYRITRSYHWFYRMYRQPVQVAEGEVKTDEAGRFEILFAPERAFEDQQRKSVSYTYKIEASLTDAKGETQSGETSISIGDKSLILNVSSLKDETNRDSLTAVIISAVNLNGVPIETSGAYRIFSLRPKQAGKLNNTAADWEQDKQIFETRFQSGKEIDLKQLKSLSSGRYRIVAEAADAEDLTFDFTLFSLSDKRPPVPLYKWLVPVKTYCAVGEKAELIFGSSAKVYVLYEIFKNGVKLPTSRFVLDNENRRIIIPFIESYGDGVVAKFTFIKDSQVFTEDVNIYRKQPDKRLTLKMEVFRDRLLPGQKEEWKISVKDATKTGLASELLASMYDASLDKIAANNFYFNPVRNISFYGVRQQTGNEFGNSSAGMSLALKFANISQFQYDELNLFGLGYEEEVIYAHKAIYAHKNSVLRTVSGIAGGVVMAESEADSYIEESVSVDMSPISSAEPPVQIRQNFAETAFFYPHLKTDSTGQTLISFTVPESNTTWKLMALAHTKDLKFGQLIAEAISQKQLMVAPNVPRFLRNGDRATLTATVSNLSESAQSGLVSLEFFNPETEQTAIAVPNAEQTFTVEAGKTTSVVWTFEVPQNIDLTALKIVARTADFSDGEQHLVPVLPNRMLVTESLALSVTGGQSRTFAFDEKPSATRQDYRMTLEFTGNPVWYAVQALPAITAPQSDNVLDWFAAYYSNEIAVRTANSNPKIRQIIEAWTKQGGSAETLLSNLEKNQELKAVLLEETPWVAEARGESEQKQRLSLLFDANRAVNLRSQALEKIRAQQCEDGGWGWFKGMNGNVSITQWLLYGFAEIGGQTQTADMQTKAVAFIDSKIKKHFDDLKKYNKEWQKTVGISTYELEYLLVRSAYSAIPLGDAKEAFNFYLNLADKYWAKTPSLYDRAIAAILLNKNGKKTSAAAILKSLREHAVRKPDYGMFWANNTANTFAFQSATCTHTFIMQAFNEVGAEASEMDDMKLWLLRQKQTQRWESVPATVSAIEILLKTGKNWLENPAKTTIDWGGKTLSTEQGEIATGYIKETAAAQEIKSEMKKITITKPDDGAGWGALYIQYFEDLDKIRASTTGLNVEKSLFVEKTGAAGKTLQPISESTPIRVGDKVTVRLTVRSDRDYEYVMLKDLRASCFEPVEQISGIQWKQGTIYYQSPKDASMNFYFDNLAKGVYVFEYGLYATAKGDYSNGTATIQCLYAPEFTAHTSGGRVSVE